MDATHIKAMTKLLKYLMWVVIPLFSISLSSCSHDDKDEPGVPDNPSKTDVISGTISYPGEIVIYIEREYFGNTQFCNVEIGDFNDGHNWESKDPNASWVDGALFLTGYYSWGTNLRINYVGNISSLKDIQSLPTDRWNVGKTLHERGGYIIEGTYNGELFYVRLYISNITENANGERIGVTYEYQQFYPNKK